MNTRTDEQALGPEAVAEELGRVGIPLASSAFVPCLDEVAAAFRSLGAERVVVKAAGLLHKTDSGGVVTGIASASAAHDAAADMLERVGEQGLPIHLQEQVDGLEMLVGVRRSPQLGAAVVVGLGGTESEIHRDITYRLAPVDHREAEALLRELRSWPLLDGFRGAPPRDVAALCDVIVKVSDLAVEQDHISELDLNPVMVGHRGAGCVVVDARIVTATPQMPRDRPRPDLDRMLRPKHVAVVGVSDDERKVGARLFRYLLDHGYAGRLDPVHPSGGEVRGRKRYERLDAVDGSPDLVCMTVPARAVPELVEQAASVDAGGVIIHSSDFAEVGEEGRKLQDDVASVLAAAGIPLAGPNSMGIVAPHLELTASISGGLESVELLPGPIALLTSSGALGSCLATRLMHQGVGVSHWIHVGNEADLVMADYLDWLVEDAATGSVALLVEDIKDGDRFVKAGRALAAAGKPVFAYNMVRSLKGREAALSHTGAMVGSFELREEVIRAAGMVSVPTLRVLEDSLLLTSDGRLPHGSRLMVVTFSGGACTIIADEAETLGVLLPELSEETAEGIRAHVPSFAAVRNPLDVSYQMMSDPESFRQVLAVLSASSEYDALLVQFTTNADPFAERIAQEVVAVRSDASVPVYVSRFGGEQLAPKALAVYAREGIPVLDAPDRATQAVATVMRARAAMRSAAGG